MHIYNISHVSSFLLQTFPKSNHWKITSGKITGPSTSILCLRNSLTSSKPWVLVHVMGQNRQFFAGFGHYIITCN